MYSSWWKQFAWSQPSSWEWYSNQFFFLARRTAWQQAQLWTATAEPTEPVRPPPPPRLLLITFSLTTSSTTVSLLAKGLTSSFGLFSLLSGLAKRPWREDPWRISGPGSSATVGLPCFAGCVWGITVTKVEGPRATVASSLDRCAFRRF